MIAPLVLALGLAMSATGNKSYLHLEVGGDAGYATLYPQQGPADGWNAGGGAFGAVNIIPRGVLDDDAPLSLQAFLQRRTLLRVVGSGGAGASHFDGGSGPDQIRRDSTFGGVEVSAWGYPHRNLYLLARFAVGSSSTRDSSPLAGPPGAWTQSIGLTPQVALGVRIYDVLVSLGWGVSAVKTDTSAFTVPFYGGAYGSLFAVIERRISMSAVFGGANGGASGSATFTGYLGRGLSLWLSIDSAFGRYADSTQTYASAGGNVGVNVWLTNRFGASLGYAATWHGDDSRSEVAHLFRLTAFARAR